MWIFGLVKRPSQKSLILSNNIKRKINANVNLLHLFFVWYP